MSIEVFEARGNLKGQARHFRVSRGAAVLKILLFYRNVFCYPPMHAQTSSACTVDTRVIEFDTMKFQSLCLKILK